MKPTKKLYTKYIFQNGKISAKVKKKPKSLFMRYIDILKSRLSKIAGH
jgi:hypothetical protein